MIIKCNQQRKEEKEISTILKSLSLNTLPQITTINVSKSNLTSFPSNIPSTISHINLSKNNLTFINLTNLKYLDVSFNSLTKIKTKNIEILKCFCNCLREIDVCSVRELYVGSVYGGNYLTSLNLNTNTPDSNLDLDFLDILDCSNNYIQNIKTKTRKLIATNNLLTEFEFYCGLVECDLSKNKISRISGDYRSLEYVDLGFNLLEYLPCEFRVSCCLLGNNPFSRDFRGSLRGNLGLSSCDKRDLLMGLSRVFSLEEHCLRTIKKYKLNSKFIPLSLLKKLKNMKQCINCKKYINDYILVYKKSEVYGNDVIIECFCCGLGCYFNEITEINKNVCYEKELVCAVLRESKSKRELLDW